jgi:hypothetical protein
MTGVAASFARDSKISGDQRSGGPCPSTQNASRTPSLEVQYLTGEVMRVIMIAATRIDHNGAKSAVAVTDAEPFEKPTPALSEPQNRASHDVSVHATHVFETGLVAFPLAADWECVDGHVR